jgi:RNA polymerase sigma factor (sigma-70 family)
MNVIVGLCSPVIEKSLSNFGDRWEDNSETTMEDDAQLLRRFTDGRSQAAFAELVHRHLSLVYHAAARQLGRDKHLAEDVAQAVFILLAVKAGSLLDRPSLAGWLHTATRFKVARAVRAERRREQREAVAHAMIELDSESTPWERVRPVVDEALHDLNARDREAILMRYFENEPVDQIAARLRLTEGAARKALERAIEKLRLHLARRGVTSSAAALATVLGSQAASASVPGGLAASVMTAVTSSGLPVVATVGGLALMSTKTALGITAFVLVLAGGAATYEVHAKHAAERALAASEAEIAAFETRLRTRQATLAREPRQTEERSAATANATAPRSSLEEKLIAGDAFLKAHPEMEAALRAYERTQLRNSYGEIIAEMGLSDAETEQFFAVLSHGTRLLLGDYFFRLSGEPQSSEAYTRTLKDVLGDARFRQFQRWEQLEPARSLTVALTGALYATPAPLTPGQIAQFKTVVEAALDDPTLGPRYDSVWPWMPSSIWDDVLKRAPEVLSPAQITALADLGRQADFMRAQSAALRAYHNKNP